jgi:transcriptional regulator, LacI family
VILEAPNCRQHPALKLSDIARLAGVSVTTASYVINGKAVQRRISAATVERVRAVIEEHGYHPDQQAASLRRGQTPHPWASSCRIWRTPATPSSPSCSSKVPARAGTSC